MLQDIFFVVVSARMVRLFGHPFQLCMGPRTFWGLFKPWGLKLPPPKPQDSDSWLWSLCNWPLDLLALSCRLSATECICVQWDLMAPHPMGFPRWQWVCVHCSPMCAPEEMAPLICPMGHDGCPPPHKLVGPPIKSTHKNLHFQRISKITVCSRKPATQCWYCEASDLLECPKPRKMKSSSKWPGSDSRGLPKSNPKVTFWPPKSASKVPSSGQKVTFGVTFRVTLGKALKVAS